MMPRLPCLAVLLLAASAYAAAPPPVTYEKWTPDDVVNQETGSGLRFSPDGRYAVWVRHAPDKDKNEMVGHLFRADLTTGKQVQLTRGKEACLSPRWSPDGAHLAFLSDRAAPKEKAEEKSNRRGRAKKDDDDKTQLWLLDPTGGEPWVLTESPRAVNLYAWADDDTLVYAAQEDAGRRETVLKDDKKDDAAVVEDEPNEPPVRLFKVEVKSKKVTRLTENKDRIEMLAVSPDGKHAVAQHARSLRYTYDNKVKPILLLHDLSEKKSKPVFAGLKNVQSVRWAPDGKGFYVTNDRNSKPDLAMAGVTELHFHDLSSGKETKLNLDWERGLGGVGESEASAAFVPLADGFVALLADGVRNRAARYAWENGKLRRDWLTGEHKSHLFGLSVSDDGKRVGYLHSTASLPHQWYHARLDGAELVDPRPVGRLNEAFDKRRRARVELVKWKGAKGEEVEGLLHYPHGYKAGQAPAPLVIAIHGGPASADLDAWDEDWAYAANLLCQRGAFVLKPNYHGSTGYGLAWLESITNGNYCDLEVEDVEKGVDALIAKKLVDPKRLGLQGWSNGAILTNILIAKTTRYKAASSGAGTVEYVSDWASCEFGDAFDRFYLGKSPLEDAQLYFKKSPVYSYQKVQTPTIIFFGTEDRVVHPQQGWMQYRALQQLGKTVRFVQFPGAKHGLKKLSHRRRKLEEEMAWFDRYLFGDEKAKSLLVKEDSPLSWLLKRQHAKKSGGRYGETVKGVLAPETVKFNDFQVGRFEVTRAQYAAFDRTYKVEAGKENLPAGGATFEKAKAYCAWLSKATGRTYRLPNETEAEELYDKSEAGENTLDAWAGYTVNLDDAVVLREKLKGLEGALLREVGQGRGSGKDELVYDLGGNVAEWTQTKDGKAALKGGSADRPADARGGAEAAEAYRGFRVVRE